jgi:RNA polymerase sigma-70 factor (ECF subfamily)
LSDAADPHAAAVSDPDAALVRAALAGDLSAFDTLVVRHQDSLFASLVCMTGNRSSAEELAQAAFVRAWEKLASFRREARFKTWLFRIAHHLCLNYLTRTRPTVELTEDFTAGSEHEPAEQLRRRRLAERVQSALNQLPPEQRTCIVSATYEDLDYREIGRRIGRSVRAVDSLLVRARRNLRRALADHQPGAGK